MQPKIIAITGSGSGIGKATALRLASRGHQVIATTHTQVAADELMALAASEQLPLEAFVLDVTKKSDYHKLQKYQLDVLINNAAIGETGSLAEVSLDKVRHNFEVNLFGPLELTQQVLKPMIARNSGTVIFISSLLGRVTSPYFGPYSMTKFALSSGAEMLRDELAEIASGVHVAVVEPGTYATGFNQKMIAKKFAWMAEDSYFFQIKEHIRKREMQRFRAAELKDLSSIVNKIVAAAEADQPWFRSSAPWWQDIGVRVLRAVGI